jgi:2-succinyl-6-hydroxy-2,4-cyclohexadiene-1-carboxylate synthase
VAKFRWQTGVVLHTETRGVGSKVVLLHGFTQNGSCWGPFGESLAKDHTTLFVDLPGHGRSAHDEASLKETANLVAEVGGRATYIGYSLGGRVALHVALQHPALVERLVLIGATGGLETIGEREQRQLADEALAASLEADGLDVFLQRWLAQPLFAGLTPASSYVDIRFQNRPEGLAASLRNTGTGRQEDLWPQLSSIQCPTLILTGSQDEKFTRLGERLRTTIGKRAEVLNVRDVGHTVHLESPTLTSDVVREWLRRPTVG